MKKIVAEIVIQSSILLTAAATATAMTYPPYEIYTGTTSGTPQLNYTKVCEPGRSGEANASYVIMGSYYPSRPALVNTGYEGDVEIPAYIGGLPVRKINDAAFIACQKIGSVTIRMDGNTPVVEVVPELSASEKAKRKYTIWGKSRLADSVWTEVSPGTEANYNFFKVSVEMK